MFFTSEFKKTILIFNEYNSSHYVLPNDLDLLGHRNNRRYFTITDMVRIEMLIRSGIWAEMKKRKIYAVMAEETAQF